MPAARLGTAKVEDIKGYPLGFGGRTYRPRIRASSLPAMPADLPSPLLGEGLYNAVKTGLAAGDAIAEVAQSSRRNFACRQAYLGRIQSVRADLARCDRLADQIFYPHAEFWTAA